MGSGINDRSGMRGGILSNRLEGVKRVEGDEKIMRR
jgi:hypothetical protein